MKKLNSMKLIMCLLFAAIVLLFHKGEAFASEVDGYKLVVGSTGTVDISDTVYELKNDTVDFYVKDKEGSDLSGVNITWTTSKPDVVSIPPTSGDSITIKREAPGYSVITATIKEDGKEDVTLKVEVKIDFKINIDGLDVSDEKIIELDANATKNVFLKYVNGDEIPTDLYEDSFIWNTGNEKVASVKATTSGSTVTAVGAGSTPIMIYAVDGKQSDLPKMFTVAVKPSFSITTEEGETKSGQYKKQDKPNTPVVYADVDDFYLKLDHGDVNNLTWVVKDASDNSVINHKDGKGKITGKASDGGTSMHFTNVKAGVYDIYAFVGSEYDTNSDVTYAFMRVVIPIRFRQDRVIMSVGDIYNILDNSNIHDIDVLETPKSNSYLQYNNNGDFIARLKGETKIGFQYNIHRKTPLYPEQIFIDRPDLEDKLKLDDAISVDFWIIDKIQLNMTEGSMYENGTLLLIAEVSNDDLRVEWKSSNENLATVSKVDESNDRKVVVTAKNIQNPLNQDEKVTITASLMDDKGVVKSVTCDITVKRAITNITINPSELTLHIGETAILDAIITPEVLNRETVLHWASSDESVVSFTVYNNTSIRVEALKAGHATITAIDQNNVIVGYSQITVDKPVESIDLSETEIITDLSIKYLQLEPIFTPADATNKKVTWFSTNEKIATVDQYGVVTIKASGEVSIVATSVDNPNAKAICNITIHTPVMSLQLEQNELELKVGNSATLSYILLPQNATNKSVVWASTNPAIADVDANGKVTAKGVGNAVIILRSLDHGLTAYCTVKVTGSGSGSSAEDAGFKFDVETLELETGDEYEVKVTFKDKGMTVTDLRWESSDTRIATVDHYGKIKAKTPGVVTISARNEDGDKVSLKLTVIEPIEEILLNFTEKEIRVKSKFSLSASVTPSNATNQKIIWKSSDTKIATVNKNGVVEGLTPGKVEIIASVEGEEVTATCVVTVTEDATGIELNYSSYRLGKGDKVMLKAKVLPEFASQSVKWVSSNPEVATVNSKGKVEGISYGYATITAITKDGTELEASCEIEVVKPVTRVELDKGYLSMMTGESKKLKATISPKNATYNTIKWTSSDDSIAIVDENGVVTAIKEGKVDITAAAEDGSGKKAVCIVNIRAGVPATGITAMEKKITMVPGESRTVKAVLNPVNSTDGITWSSDNSAIAKVDPKTGKITARSTGTANITVMTDGGKSAVIQVNVVGLSFNNLTLEQYTTYESTLTVEGTDSNVNWSIDNPSVAKITKVGKNGLRISTRAIGKATITATVDGRKLTCKLTVTAIQ